MPLQTPVPSALTHCPVTEHARVCHREGDARHTRETRPSDLSLADVIVQVSEKETPENLRKSAGPR
jgi:hypothetical protein